MAGYEFADLRYIQVDGSKDFEFIAWHLGPAEEIGKEIARWPGKEGRDKSSKVEKEALSSLMSDGWRIISQIEDGGRMIRGNSHYKDRFLARPLPEGAPNRDVAVGVHEFSKYQGKFGLFAFRLDPHALGVMGEASQRHGSMDVETLIASLEKAEWQPMGRVHGTEVWFQGFQDIQAQAGAPAAAPSAPLGPAASTTSPTTPVRGLLESLKMLGELRDSGVLTEEEFQAKKKELLGQSAGPPPAAGTAVVEGEEEEEQQQDGEKTGFSVVLQDIGADKIKVIKAVREVTTLGLRETKDLVENCPARVREGVSRDEAAQIKAVLEATGAKVAVD